MKLRNSKRSYLADFFHRVRAALEAISFRFLAESALALAAPPFKPPFRPISARYWLIGERSSSGCSSVDKRTISAARSFGSFGSFLERIMHSVWTHYQRGIKGRFGVSKLKVAHYPRAAHLAYTTRPPGGREFKHCPNVRFR